MTKNRSEFFKDVAFDKSNIVCPYCAEEGVDATQLEEYNLEGGDPVDYIISQEGTFDRLTQLFLCTSHYIQVGMPSTEDLLNDTYLVYRAYVNELPGQDTERLVEYMEHY